MKQLKPKFYASNIESYTNWWPDIAAVGDEILESVIVDEPIIESMCGSYAILIFLSKHFKDGSLYVHSR